MGGSLLESGDFQGVWTFVVYIDLVRSAVVKTRETVVRRVDGHSISSRADSILAPMRLRVRNLPTRPVAANPSIFGHIPQARLDRFIEAVHGYDNEPVLRYSQRLKLIKLATKLGIRRFDANLIIATIERNCGRASQQIKPKQLSTRMAWSLAMMIQAMLIAGVWWAFHA